MDQVRAIDRPHVPPPPAYLPIGGGRIPRPLADAVGIALLSIAGSALGFAGLWDLFRIPAAPLSPWWALAFALPGCVLVALRERIPKTALALATVLFAGDLLATGGLGALVVLLDVLWHAVHRSSARVRRRIAVVLVLVTAGFLVAALMRTTDLRIALLVTVQVATLFGTDYWWAVAVARAEEVTALERRRAADATREAIRDDREEMARELHDLVAGHVSATAIRAEAALSAPPDETRDRDALRAVRDTSLDAHAALRAMIAVLREGGPTPGPQRSELPALVRAAEDAGLRVRLFDALPAEPLPPLVEQAAMRVVREALANGMRHAARSEVDVRLDADGAEVRVQVVSRGGSGHSRPRLAGSGTGLAVLAERVRALGGEFAAGPTADGWSVTAALPKGAEA